MKKKLIISFTILLSIMLLFIKWASAEKPFNNLTPDEALFKYRKLLKVQKKHNIPFLKKVLYKQFEHDNLMVRMNIAEVLGELDDPEAIDLLWEIVHAKDEYIIRKSAIEGLCLSEDQAAFDHLKKLLYYPDIEIRRKVAECFDEFEDKPFQKSLKEAFSLESDQSIKIMMAISLAHRGDKESTHYILDILCNGAERDHRLLIAEALLDEPLNFEKQLIIDAFNKEEDNLVKIELALLMGVLNETSGISYLKTQVQKNPNPWLKLEAAEAIVEQSDPEYLEYAYPFLLELLDEDDWRIRELTVEILDDYKSFPLTPLLEKILTTDPHPTIREIAAWAMGERKDIEALKPLERGLYDENPDVRTGSLAALYKILKANKY